jgi:hypothetical protein
MQQIENDPIARPSPVFRRPAITPSLRCIPCLRRMDELLSFERLLITAECAVEQTPQSVIAHSIGLAGRGHYLRARSNDFRS